MLSARRGKMRNKIGKMPLLLVLLAAEAVAQTAPVWTQPFPQTFPLDGASGAINADAVWKKAGADQGLRQAFERAAYALEDSGHGTWRGVNAAQRLTLEFNGRETRLSHPGGSVNFHLTGYGYGDRLRRPAPARLTGTGNRMEYQRGDLTEWYVNGSQGLEQGFTLAQRPGTSRDGEPLVVALDVTGGLVPVQKAADDSVLFESDKGVMLRYAGLKALDARGRTVPSRLEVRGREIRLVVEDRAAQYPLVVDPAWTQQQERTASNAGEDQFGWSVSGSGDTAVVSSPGEAAAYVFVQSGGTWTQQQVLTFPGVGTYSDFGYSVSVSGDTVVVGAAALYGSGSAHVFVRSNGVWTRQQVLSAPDLKSTFGGIDGFGTSVSLSGNRVLIGAPYNTSGVGSAYVFVQSGGVWSLESELLASDGAVQDQFGASVSLSGNTVLIGAYGKSSSSGAAYVFVLGGGVWNQQQELTDPDPAARDYFGYSVSLSGNTAVIGAGGKTVNSQAYQGAAYVFVLSGGTWSTNTYAA